MLRMMLLGKGQINSAASVNMDGKRTLIMNTGNLREKRAIHGAEDGTKDSKVKTIAVTSAHCTQTWKGQPKPPSATLARVELQNKKYSIKRSRQVSFLNVIHNPFWLQEMKSFCFSYCVLSCFESSSRQWASQRFNYALNECDSLITKGKMVGLISPLWAVASAQDDHTNCYLE